MLAGNARGGRSTVAGLIVRLVAGGGCGGSGGVSPRKRVVCRRVERSQRVA